MLRNQLTSGRGANRGIVLIMALIVLVAMTLGAVALVRSVYTSNVIAGNLAFQQSATHSADAGVEAAIVWLENNNGQPAAAGACVGTILACNQGAAGGYLALRQDPVGTQSWRDFWDANLSTSAKTLAQDSAATPCPTSSSACAHHKAARKTPAMNVSPHPARLPAPALAVAAATPKKTTSQA